MTYAAYVLSAYWTWPNGEAIVRKPSGERNLEGGDSRDGHAMAQAMARGRIVDKGQSVKPTPPDAIRYHKRPGQTASRENKKRCEP